MGKKMSKEDLEEAFAEATKDQRRCVVRKALDNMDPEYREVIQAKVDDNARYSAAVISKVLKATLSVTISSTRISNHRTGDCRCTD